MSILARAKAAMYSNKSVSQESREGPPWVIIAFTVKLILGLIASQVSAIAMKHSAYHLWSEVVELLTMACLAFIMVNVGFEFTLDKSNMRQYGKDFVIAMAAAGIPAAFVALWFMFALSDPLPWTLAFLSGLFAAPTSAGILFSMLEAAGLKETWLFRKARVLAVFDDLGTLLLLVPLKILVSGFHWELMIEVGLVFLMLGIAYWKLHALRIPSSWRWTAVYAVLVTAMCKLVRYVTEEHIAMEAIEMEVLLPAFTLGCITHVCHDAEDVEHGHNPEEVAAAEAEKVHEERVKTGVSMVFMLLVGLSMPCLFGSNHRNTPSGHHPDHEHSHAHDRQPPPPRCPKPHAMQNGRALAACLLALGFAPAAGEWPGTFLARRRLVSEELAEDPCASVECPEGHAKWKNRSLAVKGYRIQASSASWDLHGLEFRTLAGEVIELEPGGACELVQSGGSYSPGQGWKLRRDSDGLLYLGVVCKELLVLGSVAIKQKGSIAPMEISVQCLRQGTWTPIVQNMKLSPSVMLEVVSLAETTVVACCQRVADTHNDTPSAAAPMISTTQPTMPEANTPSHHIAIIAAGPLLLVLAVAVRLWYHGRQLRQKTKRKSHAFLPTLDLAAMFGTPTPAARRNIAQGVSVEYLIDVFPEEARTLTGLDNPDFHEICKVMAIGPTGKGYGKTCPRDGRPGCSIVDAIDECHRGTATHFLSWCWNYRLADFESAIRRWAQAQDDDPKDVFLWVCFFCNNQYRLIEAASQTGSEGLDSTFEGPLVATGQMLVMLDTFWKPCYITRAWCIFECFVCMHQELTMTVILPESAEKSFSNVLDSGFGLGSIRQAFSQIDLRQAVASYKADEDRIKELIRSSIGFDVVNDAVKECLMDWLTGKFQSYLRGEISRAESVFI